MRNLNNWHSFCLILMVIWYLTYINIDFVYAFFLWNGTFDGSGVFLLMWCFFFYTMFLLMQCFFSCDVPSQARLLLIQSSFWYDISNIMFHLSILFIASSTINSFELDSNNSSLLCLWTEFKFKCDIVSLKNYLASSL